MLNSSISRHSMNVRHIVFHSSIVVFIGERSDQYTCIHVRCDIPSACRVEPAHADGVRASAVATKRHYRGARPRQLDLLKLRTKRASQALAVVVRHRQHHPYDISSSLAHCKVTQQSPILYTGTEIPFQYHHRDMDRS